MKKTIKLTALVLVALMLLFSLISCDTTSSSAGDETSQTGGVAERTGAWENATHVTDKEFGKGSKTVVVQVKAEGQMVTFTIKTDKKTVGEALFEHDLIAGEEGAYGLYVKKVNGMVADYDANQTYWAFYVNGEYGMAGVDMTEIDESATYKLELTKG